MKRRNRPQSAQISNEVNMNLTQDMAGKIK